MSPILVEENCTDQLDLCQSTELDKLEEEWSNIILNYVTRNILKYKSG